jgi:hypothetical protein
MGTKITSWLAPFGVRVIEFDSVLSNVWLKLEDLCSKTEGCLVARQDRGINTLNCRKQTYISKEPVIVTCAEDAVLMRKLR